MQVNIESVGESDYPEIVEVWEASVRATHHFLSEETIQFFKPLILRDYLKAVELRCVRNEQDRIVGFLGVAERKLEMMFLHPDYIGQGIGKALLNYALDTWAINKVDVNEDNPEAVRFYQRMGFVTVSRSPLDGLGKPFPILHMELKTAKT